MDLFALMAVRATHWEEVKEFLSTMGSPLVLGLAIGVILLLLLAAYVLTQQVGRCAESGEGLLKWEEGQGRPDRDLHPFLWRLYPTNHPCIPDQFISYDEQQGERVSAFAEF